MIDLDILGLLSIGICFIAFIYLISFFCVSKRTKLPQAVWEPFNGLESEIIIAQRILEGESEDPLMEKHVKAYYAIWRSLELEFPQLAQNYQRERNGRIVDKILGNLKTNCEDDLELLEKSKLYL